MQWPDFSNHNVKLLKRTLIQNGVSTHFFVVVPLTAAAEIEQDVKSAFFRYGFSEESNKLLVAPLTKEIVTKLTNTPDVTMIDVHPDEVDEQHYCVQFIIEQPILEEMTNESVPNIDNQVTYDDVKPANDDIPKLDNVFIERSVNDNHAINMLTKESSFNNDKPGSQTAALFSAQLKIVKAHPFTHKNQQTALLANIFIQDKKSLASGKYKSVIWFEGNTPFIAYQQGSVHYVVSLTETDTHDLSGLGFKGVNIVDQSMSVPGQYELAFKRLASSEMTLVDTSNRSKNDQFSAKECELFQFASEADRSSATIFLVEREQHWLSGHAYEFQVGNYASIEALPNTKNRLFEDRDTAIFDALGKLVATMQTMLINEQIETVQRNEIANILVWAGEKKERLLNKSQVEQSNDSSKNHDEGFVVSISV